MVCTTPQQDLFEPSARAARVHAMKNCVSVIFALSRLAEREVPETSKQRWEHLRSAAQRLRQLLLEDLAEESGKAVAPHPSLARCNVEALVRSVVERLEPRAAEAEVEVSVCCGGGSIEMEEAAVGEALLNLVANAIEATPRGGKVLLETRQLDNGDQEWLLRDTGLGIPSDHLHELGHTGLSQKEGGSGMGFALARATFRRHGGSLRVDSDGRSGTSIAILLRRQRSFPGERVCTGSASADAQRSEAPARSPMTVRIAVVRAIVDELERTVTGCDQCLPSSVGLQLAEELDLLADALRAGGAIGVVRAHASVGGRQTPRAEDVA